MRWCRRGGRGRVGRRWSGVVEVGEGREREPLEVLGCVKRAVAAVCACAGARLGCAGGGARRRAAAPPPGSSRHSHRASPLALRLNGRRTHDDYEHCQQLTAAELARGREGCLGRRRPCQPCRRLVRRLSRSRTRRSRVAVPASTHSPDSPRHSTGSTRHRARVDLVLIKPRLARLASSRQASAHRPASGTALHAQ